MLVALLFSAFAFSGLEYEARFTDWMVKYNKQYTADEVMYRFENFKATLDFVTSHNERYEAGEETYFCDTNQFADLTRGEFKDIYLGYAPWLRSEAAQALRSAKTLDQVSGGSLGLSGDFSWVNQGAVTPVKNQGQCGSCWAFSTTGSMEGVIEIDHKELTSLSEQQLVDCAGSYGNMGCNGGLMDYAFKYTMANGLCTEAAYPYTGVRGTCKSSQCQAAPNTHLSGYTDVTGGECGTKNSLETDINTEPISIAIEADQAGFQSYKGGVFSGPCGQNLDHGVLLVGYGTSNGQNYWTVKNSWGTSWGEGGYIRMIRGQDECGLGNEPSYPLD